VGDARRRALERAVAAGDLPSRVRLLQERARRGELPAGGLELAAYLGHGVARAAVGERGGELVRSARERLAELARWEARHAEALANEGTMFFPRDAAWRRPVEEVVPRWMGWIAELGAEVRLRIGVALARVHAAGGLGGGSEPHLAATIAAAEAWLARPEPRGRPERPAGLRIEDLTVGPTVDLLNLLFADPKPLVSLLGLAGWSRRRSAEENPSVARLRALLAPELLPWALGEADAADAGRLG